MFCFVFIKMPCRIECGEFRTEMQHLFSRRLHSWCWQSHNIPCRTRWKDLSIILQWDSGMRILPMGKKTKWHWWHQQLRSARRRLQTKLLRLRSRYGYYDFTVKPILTFDLFIATIMILKTFFENIGYRETILCILSYHLTCIFFIL